MASASSAAFVSKLHATARAFPSLCVTEISSCSEAATCAPPGAVMPSEILHALVVVLEQLTGDRERVALLRFLEIMQHHLQGEQGLPSPLARGGVKADPVHQRVNRTAEHDRIGSIIHVAVVIDPIADHGRLEHRKRGAVPHGVLPNNASQPAGLSPAPANIFAFERDFDKAIVAQRHEFAVDPPSYLLPYALPGPQNEA